MIIKRERYLNKLIAKRENGLVKIITGIRRCGKSFLLFELYHRYLNSIGVSDDDIIELALDDITSAKLRNPLNLDAYIRELTQDKSRQFYVFIDEIQNVATIRNPYVDEPDAVLGFVDVILGLMKLANVDLYITGSNSKMLSSDIVTEFRGRGDEVHVNPLTYSEYIEAYAGDERNAWKEYVMYGGMPFVLSLESHEDKSKYLKDLFTQTYISDVLERNKISNDAEVLGMLLDIVSSAVGSLTNPSKLSDTFKSKLNISINQNTIGLYLQYFMEAFILCKAKRYDIKGKRYIGTPMKYYYTDIGLRNARLNFRQQEENHIMENIVYNELTARDFDVDVGVVEYNHTDAQGRKIRSQLEVDFVVNKGSTRYYIQSAYMIGDEEKRQQEISSLVRIPDSFKKIVVVRDDIIPRHDDNGILYIGIEQFLRDENAVEL